MVLRVAGCPPHLVARISLRATLDLLAIQIILCDNEHVGVSFDCLVGIDAKTLAIDCPDDTCGGAKGGLCPVTIRV